MSCSVPTTTTARPGTRSCAFTPPVVGLGTLRRLAELDSGARPMLSVYLSLDPSGVTACEAELAALASWPSPYAGEAEVGRVRAFLRSMPAFAHGTRSLGLFSHSDGSELEVLPLPERVAAMAVLDAQAWLEPLADMLCAGDSGAVVAGPSSARLFRGGTRGLIEFAVVRGAAHDRHLEGDNSLGSPYLLVEDDEWAIVRRLAELLCRAHRRRAFDTLAVAAPRELWLPIAEALPGALRSRLVGFVALDLREAPAHEVARALSSLLEQATPSGEVHGRSTPTGDHAQAIAITQDTWPWPQVMWAPGRVRQLGQPAPSPSFHGDQLEEICS